MVRAVIGVVWIGALGSALAQDVAVDLLGAIPAGKSVTITYEVVVDTPVPAGTEQLSNQGTVLGTDVTAVSTDDPTAPGADDPTLTSVVAAPALAPLSTKTVVDADADGLGSPDETLTYAITVTNTGDEGAASVRVTDAAPANTTFDADSAVVVDGLGAIGAVATNDASSLTVDVAELSGGAGFVTVELTATVASDVPAGTDTIDNTAQIEATDVVPFDTGTASLPVGRGLGDFVWYDTDADGIQDAGEPGLADVSVELLNDGSCAGGVVAGPFLTDADGRYSLRVAAGTYCIRVFDLPSGFSSSPTGQGGDPTLDSDAVATADPTVVQIESVTIDDDDTDRDVGLFALGSVGDVVWCDTALGPADGIFSAGEGLTDVTVGLFEDTDCDTVADGPLEVTQTTDDGAYTFGALAVGPPAATGVDPICYVVRVDVDDPNLGLCDTPLDATSVAIGLDADAPDRTDIDFGFEKPDSPTVALLTGVRAFDVGGAVLLEWTTASEVGTVGFQLQRWAAGSETFRPVHDDLLPALLGSPHGGTYRYLDDGAAPGDDLRYRLVEIEASGRRRSHGPFAPTLEVAPVELAQLTPFRRGAHAVAPVPEEASRRIESPTFEVEAVKLEVEHTGIHRVAIARLAAAFGAPIDDLRSAIAAGQLALALTEQPLAWRSVGDDIVFHVEVLPSLHAATDVVWARLESGRALETRFGFGPLPVDVPGSFLETVRFEEQLLPVTKPALRGPEEDFWFWKTAHAASPEATQTFSLALDGVVPGDTAALAVRAHGATDTGHRLRVTLNGSELGDDAWRGLEAHSVSFPIDSGLLQPGDNTVEVEAQLDEGEPYSLFHIDDFVVTYRRRLEAVDDRLRFRAEDAEVATVSGLSTADVEVYAIDDPNAPTRIAAVTVDGTGPYRVSFEPTPGVVHEVVASSRRPVSVRADHPSDLRGHPGAEHVIVAPGALVATAKSLAEHRREQGLTSIVVDLEDVFDEFGHGRASPAALQAFLAHAWSHWPERPRYAVLVGSGSYDPLDHLGYGDARMPTRMVLTPDGLFAADPGFGDAIGDDGVPEISVGRIPVRSADELESVVAKLIAHEGAARAPTVGLLLADDPDAGGDFPADSDRLAELLPAALGTERIYLSDEPIAAARERLFGALDVGADWVSYLGHGGVDRLAGEGLLTTADVALLSNATLPTFWTLTCTAGEFELPGVISLGEELLLHPGGGAAAVLAPTGLSRHAPAMAFGEAWVAALHSGEHARLGDALRRAQADYAATQLAPYLLDVYTLLGDPAQPIPARR